MFKTIALIATLALSTTAQASEMFSDCENVSEMAVLAKDNTPFWSKENVAHLSAKGCYADIKEFVLVASQEDIEQFNSEYDGQIVIFSNDQEFSEFVVSKKESHQHFAIEANMGANGLTPVIKPLLPQITQIK